MSKDAYFLLYKEAETSKAPKRVREQEAHTTYQAQSEDNLGHHKRERANQGHSPTVE